jgi:hypothetical protein
MDREQDVLNAYATGVAALNRGSEMGGSVSATYFLMPCAVSAARAMGGGTEGPRDYPPFVALSPEERFAVGLIHDVIIEREDIEVTFPRLMEPIIILGSQTRDLKRAPLARMLFRKRLTEAALAQLTGVISAATTLVREIQADGIPREADEGAFIRPGILVHRRPREIGDNWAEARSWLGGRPRLGEKPWPRDRKGQPLHFAAQLDLAEIAAACGATDLPCEGSLAFFIGREGAVVHIPPDGAGDFTEPPDGLPPFEDVGLESPGIDGIMPRWPVAFVPLPLVSDRPREKYDQQSALIAARFNQPKYGLSARAAFAGPPIPRWWQTAYHYVDFLSAQRARIPAAIEEQQKIVRLMEEALASPESAAKDLAGYEATRKRYVESIETIRRLAPELDAYIEQVKTWCSAQDPWSEMPDAEWARLDAYWRRTPEFGPITGYGQTDIDDLAEKMFEALPAQDTPALAALPAEVRTIIDQRRAPRPQWWHTAHLIVAALNEAAEKGGEHASAPAFRDFHSRIATWVRGHDPWSRMEADDVAHLVAAHRGCQKEFEALLRWKIPRYLEDLETVTLNRLLGGEEDAYATLPERARAIVNREHLLPPGPCHQMFGQFIAIQGNAAEDNYDRLMLLQLSHDYLMFWRFGDAGAYQFWIAPDDLKRSNWSAAKLTFEGH